MTEDLSRERKWAGKACIYAGNFLVALHGAALLFDPSAWRGLILVLSIAAYVVLHARGGKLLDGFFGAIERL